MSRKKSKRGVSQTNQQTKIMFDFALFSPEAVTKFRGGYKLVKWGIGESPSSFDTVASCGCYLSCHGQGKDDG